MTTGCNDEEDYLSDKFLLETSSSAAGVPKTYRERRKEAERLARIRNEQNKTKSRRQRELEAREEGLGKSLFDRAKEEEQRRQLQQGQGHTRQDHHDQQPQRGAVGNGEGGHGQEGEGGVGPANKALSIMMKMGFKPGDSLGRNDGEDEREPVSTNVPPSSSDVALDPPQTDTSQTRKTTHRAEPLPILEWEGKVGIGSRKRAPPPSSSLSLEKLAKSAKTEVDEKQVGFRDRTRAEYEERRAERRLLAARRTCTTLDENIGVPFNPLCLDPQNEQSFPDGLLDALRERAASSSSHPGIIVTSSTSATQRSDGSTASRLRRQMEVDALVPLSSVETADDEEYDHCKEDDDAAGSSSRHAVGNDYSLQILDEALRFLQLSATQRLQLLLEYLRRKHSYCFWCGAQYQTAAEMAELCPGADEEAHD